MTHLLRGRGIVTFIMALFVLFIVAAKTLPPHMLIEGARTLHITLCFAVLMAYGLIAARALIKPKLNSGDVLGLAIGMSFLGNLGFGGWALLWRLSGKPPWMADADMVGFWIAVQTVAAMFYLAAPGAIDGHVPPRNRIIIAASAAVGLLILMLVTITSADFSGVSEYLRPWFGEGIKALPEAIMY